MTLPEIEQEETPKGKRTVRANIWGNLVGYIGRRRWQEFGTNSVFNQRQAEAWKNGDPNWRDA